MAFIFPHVLQAGSKFKPNNARGNAVKISVPELAAWNQSTKV